MSELDNNEIVMTVMIFAAILYGLSISNIKLPCSVKNLFNNIIFKMVFLSLILVYNFEKSPHIALTIAVVFILTLDYLNKEKMYENCAYLKSFIQQNTKKIENTKSENVQSE